MCVYFSQPEWSSTLKKRKKYWLWNETATGAETWSDWAEGLPLQTRCTCRFKDDSLGPVWLFPLHLSSMWPQTLKLFRPCLSCTVSDKSISLRLQRAFLFLFVFFSHNSSKVDHTYWNAFLFLPASLNKYMTQSKHRKETGHLLWICMYGMCCAVFCVVLYFGESLKSFWICSVVL